MDFDRNDSNSIVAIRSELAGPLSTIQAKISATTASSRITKAFGTRFQAAARSIAGSFAPAAMAA